MKFIITQIFCLVAFLVLGCNDGQLKVKDVNLTDLQTKEQKNSVAPSFPAELKVSAYLIYQNGSNSDFDILNDKSIALWNTIIGGGDAEQASEKVLVKFTGQLDSLNVVVYKAEKAGPTLKLPSSFSNYEYVIHDTGCEELKIVVSKLDKEVYRGVIPFRCGE
jgi:hypothetical protein